MGNRSDWNAMVLAVAMVSGCTTTVQSSGEVRILTGIEMDRITAGSAVAVNEATAHALGAAPQTAVSATTQAYSGSPIAGAPFLNYATSQATASASRGELVQAGLSSQILSTAPTVGPGSMPPPPAPPRETARAVRK
jgi:hypothetical protein